MSILRDLPLELDVQGTIYFLEAEIKCNWVVLIIGGNY